VKSKDENLEVAPMMDTIKNMVTEMPEPETYEKLFEKIEETPTFIPKQKEVSNKNKEFQVSLDQERENAIYAKIDARFSAAEASFLKSIYQSIISESKKVEEL